MLDLNISETGNTATLDVTSETLGNTDQHYDTGITVHFWDVDTIARWQAGTDEQRAVEVAHIMNTLRLLNFLYGGPHDAVQAYNTLMTEQHGMNAEHGVTFDQDRLTR